jgi:hypothetical protein
METNPIRPYIPLHLPRQAKLCYYSTQEYSGGKIISQTQFRKAYAWTKVKPAKELFQLNVL